MQNSCLPGFRDLAQIEALEAVPLASRDLAGSTYALLQRSAAAWPDRPAFTLVEAAGHSQTQSYGELLGRVQRIGNRLLEHGAGAGAAVAICLPNCLDYPALYLAASAVSVAFPVNPLLAPEQIAALLRRAGARILVGAGPEFPELAEKAVQVAALVDGLVLLTVDGDELAGTDPRPLAVPADPGRIASLFATGGTTGDPKLAQHTHGNECFSAWAIAEAIALTPDDVLLCGLPLFHVNGITVTGLAPLSRGAHVVLLGAGGFRDPAIRAAFWQLASRFGATVFSAVPTVLDALLAVPAAGADLSRLRLVACGAAPLSRELLQKFERQFGLPLVEGYGLTEGTCVSALNPPAGVRKLGSVGLRLPYQQLRCMVAGADGTFRQCEADEVGALWIRGPNVFPGYLGAPPAAGAADGWFDTGDLARQDADGYVWLAGRAKDIIIRGGHNIDPALTEEALHRHPSVRLAAAVALPDRRLGEVPVAFVMLHRGAAVTPDELVAFARDACSERAAAPVQVVAVGELPLTAVGKVFKPALRLEACRMAYQQALHEHGIAAGVLPRLDPMHGIVVDILPPDHAGEADIAAALSGFVLPWNIQQN